MKNVLIIIFSYFTTFCSSSGEFQNIASKTSGSKSDVIEKGSDSEEEEEEIEAVPPTIISGAYLACNLIGKDENTKQVSASCSLQKENIVLEIPDLLQTDFKIKDGNEQIPLTNFTYMGSGYYELSFTHDNESNVSIGLTSINGAVLNTDKNKDLVTSLNTKKQIVQEPETGAPPDPADENPSGDEVPPEQSPKKPTIDCNIIGIPGSWVFVPGDPIYQTSDFCVMKYEAKEDNGIPVSKAALRPWVSIRQSEAIQACASLGPDYHLISNHEWMSLATNIVHVDANWTGGTLGVGKLVQGNSDAGANRSCSADKDDLNAFINSNCEISATSDNPSFRRTHVLSNTNIIWDLAGNVWEWTSDIILPSTKPGPHEDNYLEYTEPLTVTDASFPITELIPQIALDNLWNSEQGVGEYFPGADDQGGAIRRGGDYDNKNGGILSARLSNDGDRDSEDLGFRCVRRLP